MTLILVAIVLLQDKAAPDLEALRKELHAKFEALGPLSATISHVAIDAKGVKTVAYTTDFHLRMAEAWLYIASKRREDPKGPVQEAFMINSGIDPMLYWMKDGAGSRLDYSRYYRALWQVTWEAARERNQLFGEPDAFKSLEEYVASMRTILNAHLEPEPSGEVKAFFRMTVGKGEKGGPSWLALLSKESKVEVTVGTGTITVREPDAKRTTEIDRKTGFLRSMRLDFPKGEARLVLIDGVALGAPKPEIRLPERWKDRQAPDETAASTLAWNLAASARKTVETVLERWDRMKPPDRVDAIRRYFAWFAGMQEALQRESSRVYWAESYVKSVVEGGAKLDDLVRDPDNWADKLEVYIKWGEKEHASTFTEYVDGIQKDLLKKVAESPGSEAARKGLEALIKEGFEPEQVKKARPKRPAPDYVFLLRDAVENQRPGD